MGIYAVTGGSSGMGASLVALLTEGGHEAINIDIKESDIVADLSCAQGRQAAADKLAELAPDGLDGLVCNAGINGQCGNWPLLISLNYFGSADLARIAWPLVEKKHGGIVVTVSNTIAQSVERKDIADMLVGGVNEQEIRAYLATLDQTDFHLGHNLYVATKYALAKWVRNMSATSAARGVRINAVAPGNIRTPMTESLQGYQKDAMNALQVPTSFGREALLEPEEVAHVMAFLLSPESSGINGTVLFVDGGTDALLRPNGI